MSGVKIRIWCIMFLFILLMISLASMEERKMVDSTIEPLFSSTKNLAFVEKEFKVTAYCPCGKCCGKFANGVTASGHLIQKGDKFVAAPKEISFNAVLEIPGYGIATVLDRGGDIKENRLDVFFHTHEEALQWGVKNLEVKIYIQERK